MGPLGVPVQSACGQHTLQMSTQGWQDVHTSGLAHNWLMRIADQLRPVK